MTSIRANAVKSVLLMDGASRQHRAARARSTPSRPLFSRLAAGPQILEELGVGLEHEHIALVLETLLVRFDASIEREKLGIDLVGAGIDGTRLRIAVTLDPLRVAVRLGKNDLALTIGICAYLFRLCRAGRAQLVGDALALRFHAAVNGLAHFLRQINALHAHIEHLHPDFRCVIVRSLTHELDDLVALAR